MKKEENNGVIWQEADEKSICPLPGYVRERIWIMPPKFEPNLLQSVKHAV